MNSVILSYGLDTNGQNARYAKASETWGTDEGVLKALAVGDYDPAGVVGRFQFAAEKFGELRIRSVHRQTHIYQQMPADILWRHNNEREIRELAAEADILHLNNSAKPFRRLRLPNRAKPVLLHHHGSLFRNGPVPLMQEARNLGALQAVSTVDLMRIAPETLHWLPTAYDIDWLADFGKENRDDHDGIRVIQCPTDGVKGPYKSTDKLEAAVARLRSEGMDIELVVVRDKPWAEAMTLKASADIYFDQVKLGYGCNAVEAWGMGIPVIAGADDWTLAKMREVYGSDTLPFYVASEDTIYDALADLASSKAKRTTYAKRGMAHVRKFHDERPALTRLAELYNRAITHPVDNPVPTHIEPVTFRAAIPQVNAGKRVTFVNGVYTTDNPHIATRLRYLARRYPKYGIEEVA